MPFISLESVPWRAMLPGARARFVHSASMTVSHWEFEGGAALPAHAHPHEQITTCLSGRFELTVSGEARILVAGSMAIIPPDATHSGRALSDSRLVDVFHPVRDDYR